MTGAEWATCDDSGPMLEHLGRRVTARKGRLFAVACCRRLQFAADEAVIPPDPEGGYDRGADYRRAVDVAERYADRRATADELKEAFWGADDSALINSDLGYRQGYGGGIDPFRDVASADREQIGRIWRELLLVARGFGTHRTPAGRRRRRERRVTPARLADERAERAAQAGLVRCLFPFTPVAADPSCRTAAAVGLARTVYDERAWDRLPILADELEDSGCTDERVLGHCRAGGEHARGCWPVDAVLGKK